MHPQSISIGAHGMKPLTITISVAVALSGLGKTKFYELMRDGRIKTTNVDGKRLVIYSSLEALLIGDAEAPKAA